jgi:hypothetical protein
MNNMIQTLQSLTSAHPQGNTQGVASIQWQKQHYSNNALGAIIQQLSEAVASANASAKPYTLFLEGSDARNAQYGPYHITPVWNDALKILTLEITNERQYTPDSDIITSFKLPIALIKNQLATLATPEVSANAVTVAKNSGSIAIREYMMNHHITPSDSLARGLFDALAAIHTERNQSRGR